MAISIQQPLSTLDYPDTDGLPMAESDFQLIPMIYMIDALRTYFAARADVYVAGNMFIYYEEGKREAVIAPDVFVIFGTAKHPRSSYFLWREPKGPDFVLEITSESTRTQDQLRKPQIYAQLGVQEYFQYDPTQDYLTPPLQGWQLVNGVYQPLPARRETRQMRVISSPVLGLDLCFENDAFYFYASDTRQKLLTHQESEEARVMAEQAQFAAEQACQEAEQARQEAEQQRLEEVHKRQELEARLAELEARLRKP